MATELLAYRPWRGEFNAPVAAIWPIARVALRMMFRRKLFWALYGVALLFFLLFFFGQYMLAWADAQMGETAVRIGGARVDPTQLVGVFRNVLHLHGQAEMYADFFSYQGHMVMIVLALAGSLLVGNDIHLGSLPFYLSKPLSRFQYVLGKCLAVGVFVNLLTTLPALALYFEFGFLSEEGSFWAYYVGHTRLFFAILGYGLVLTVSMSLLLVATATWVRRTVPMIMTWTTLFLFFRILSRALVVDVHWSRRWRLIDLWTDTHLVGCALLGHRPAGELPRPAEAALVLVAVAVVCLVYLTWRIRAVEVVG